MLRSKAFRTIFSAAVVTMVVTASTVYAWHQEGHEAISRAAVMSLPESVPAFLREGVNTVAHCSVDPDLARTKPMTQLGAAISPEHYFDLERVEINKLPDNRHAFVAQLTKRDLDVRDVGLGLYVILETRQQLTVALAEHRKWPNNKAIQAKCLVYAGHLAHYASDLAQPLHTTIHYDGKTLPNGRSPHSGIHEKVDALLKRLPADMLKPPADFTPKVMPQGLAPILEFIQSSHSHVDELYELEPLLPHPNAGPATKLDPKVQAFAKARFDAGTQFTASLILTAWEDSADIKLPGWLDRSEE